MEKDTSLADTVQDRYTLISLTSDMVAAHVSHNSVPANRLPMLISGIYQALADLRAAPAAKKVPPKPAVSVRASVKPEHVVCLECGKKMSMLKRHLRVGHGLSPVEYRQRWGLAWDHPLVAPSYAKRRSLLAKQIGLGNAAWDRRKEPEAETARPQRRKRETLSLWRNGDEKSSMPRAHDLEAVRQASPDPEPSPEKTLLEAIASLRMVSANYNGRELDLAPHHLFSRHGQPFLAAFNPRKKWANDEERWLGLFKVSGLSNVALLEDTFVPLPTFDGSLPREGDESLVAVSTC